ncbi:hypothetical protein ACK11Z_11370, partial [Methanoculleus bourgensis]|uniref:hypothetical protein n=1 Tax=Methanoculleus bourgensis TaxID=83986 RepID=UPI003B9324B4
SPLIVCSPAVFAGIRVHSNHRAGNRRAVLAQAVTAVGLSSPGTSVAGAVGGDRFCTKQVYCC